MAVDDEADITFTLKKELEQSGLSADVFNDPTSALSNFKPGHAHSFFLERYAKSIFELFSTACKAK
jgi:DNA-binding response OmpR family regulator